MGQEELLKAMADRRPVVWENDRQKAEQPPANEIPAMEEVLEADRRLRRFAPLLVRYFPETGPSDGLIESRLQEIQRMSKRLNEEWGAGLCGRLFLKMDSELPVASSVKARGGIYEILKYAEQLAISHGLLKKEDSYARLAEPEARGLFARHAIHVSSTGNLGLSVGTISAALGFSVTVHMSRDAKAWKKALLRERGAKVMEYDGDYSLAVKEGRQAASVSGGYFVDDEASRDLFLGYSVAALRLKEQMDAMGLTVDADHPLFVYLPCGVGGAPGGISFGLKQIWGELVSCFFVEPVEAPCMLLGMVTGLHNDICVQDIGLSGVTEADGLAVGRPSKFVGRLASQLISGEMTVEDSELFRYLRTLWDSEGIFLEPSACAGFQGAVKSGTLPLLKSLAQPENGIHIVWATGGGLVPPKERARYLEGEILDKA